MPSEEYSAVHVYLKGHFDDDGLICFYYWYEVEVPEGLMNARPVNVKCVNTDDDDDDGYEPPTR